MKRFDPIGELLRLRPLPRPILHRDDTGLCGIMVWRNKGNQDESVDLWTDLH